MTWCFALGTRPEVIKLAPVIREAQTWLPGIQVALSGQHREMGRQFCEDFGIKPTVEFRLATHPNNHLPELLGSLISEFGRLFADKRPSVVVVQGDTMTAHSASTAAFLHGIPVAHVEAGLRTRDIMRPFPEEWTRQSIALLAHFHFAPTPVAVQNLEQEGIPSSRIWTTGNTGLDTLRQAIEAGGRHMPGQNEQWHRKYRKYVLLTMHRREDRHKFATFKAALVRALTLHPDIGFLFTAHPNGASREALASAEVFPNFAVVDALPYQYFSVLLAGTLGIITDSGGIQEEAVFLDKPLVVLRASTERTDSLEFPNVLGLGLDLDLSDAITQMKDYSPRLTRAQRTVFGDGHAAGRIVRVMLDGLS